MAEKTTSTELVLHNKIKAFEKAAADLIIFSEQQYGDGSRRKKNPNYQEKMDNAFKLFSRLCEGLGQTEYGVEPYTGEQTLEKYRHAVSESWGTKAEPEGSVKAITQGEIVAGSDAYERRKEDISQRRKQLLIAEAEMKKLYIEQAAASGKPVDDGELDADDVVDQALHNKRHPNRPALIQATYKPLFGGKEVQRRVLAAPQADDIDDYHGYQNRLLKEAGDDDAMSREEVASKMEKGMAARRAVMEERERRSDARGSHYSTQQQRLGGEDEDDEDDGRLSDRRATGAAASAASRARRQTKLADEDDEDNDDNFRGAPSRSGKKPSGMQEMDASDMMTRRKR